MQNGEGHPLPYTPQQSWSPPGRSILVSVGSPPRSVSPFTLKHYFLLRKQKKILDLVINLMLLGKRNIYIGSTADGPMTVQLAGHALACPPGCHHPPCQGAKASVVTASTALLSSGFWLGSNRRHQQRLGGGRARGGRGWGVPESPCWAS